MALGDRRDPYLSLRFLVEIEGLVVGGFSEVSGLQAEVEVESYREGGTNEYVHQLPGPTRYPQSLVLRHGLTELDTLWSWHQEVQRGVIRRRNGSIVLLDAAGAEGWRWNFVGAYPVRWSGPELRAGTSDVAVETVELIHHGLTRGA
jgi:phage tail-like protein